MFLMAMGYDAFVSTDSFFISELCKEYFKAAGTDWSFRLALKMRRYFVADANWN